MSQCLDMALWLLEQGCSVIPIAPRSKKPCVSVLPEGEWKAFQTRRATEQEVRAWFAAKPDINIALVCGAVSGVVAVDVDGEKGQEWFKLNMPKPNLFQFTSAKYKFHAFYKHPGNGVRIPPCVKLVEEIDIRGDGSYVVFSPSTHPSGAVYELRKMDGFTGFPSLVPMPDLPVHKNDKGNYEWTGGRPARTNSSLQAGKGNRNDTLTSFCGRMYARGCCVEEVLLAAHGWNQSCASPPLPANEVETVVKSMSKTHAGRNPEALNAGAVERWVKMAQGEFTIADIYRDLNLTTSTEKGQVRHEIKQLVSCGLLETCRGRNGWYRHKDNSVTVIDLETPEEPQIQMWLPFNLHHDVIIHQKNVVIVAGETNSGKTGFLFNLAFMNMHRHSFKYFTSEMTGSEIKNRIKSFGKPVEAWRNVSFIERGANFQDVIDPDGINIVDFLEIHDKFYAVGEEIRRIFESLRTGVVFIAMQKRTGELLARGGEFSLEKARLGLSLFTHGRLPDGIVGSVKVTKAKHFYPGRNPEGKEQFFTLTRGYLYDDAPLKNIYDRGFKFYTKKERERNISVLEHHCKEAAEERTADQIADFYGYNGIRPAAPVQ